MAAITVRASAPAAASATAPRVSRAPVMAPAMAAKRHRLERRPRCLGLGQPGGVTSIIALLVGKPQLGGTEAHFHRHRQRGVVLAEVAQQESRCPGGTPGDLVDQMSGGDQLVGPDMIGQPAAAAEPVRDFECRVRVTAVHR